MFLKVLSKDSVTVAVDAVVYFRISNATISVTNVEDASRSTKLLAQTTLRNVLGTRTLAEMLSDREAISMQMQVLLYCTRLFFKWNERSAVLVVAGPRREFLKDITLPSYSQKFH